jgi:hypothetical protein
LMGWLLLLLYSCPSAYVVFREKKAAPCRCCESKIDSAGSKRGLWRRRDAQAGGGRLGRYVEEAIWTVDTVHGEDGAGLSDGFPLSQGASECRAKGKLARQTGSDALEGRTKRMGRKKRRGD